MVYSSFLTAHAGSSNSTIVTYGHAPFNSTARPVIHSEMEVPVAEGSVAYKASEGNSVGNSTSSPSQSAYGGMGLPLQVLLSAIMLVITLISFLGNFIVCLMVYQKAAMRSAINILLANLAFADMMLAIMNMPFALITVNTTYWIFGDNFCRVSAMFFWLFVIEGVVILLIISIDRFLIIVQRQDKLNPYRAKLLIAVSWGMAFCMAFPLAVGSPDLPVPSRAPQCVFGYSTDPGYRVYVLLIIIVFFIIPFMLMLYSFMGILNTVRHNAIRIHSNSDGICLGQASKLGLMSLQKPCQLTIDMSFKTRAFTTILILFITFTLCSAPFTTYSLVSTFNKSFYHKVNFFEISTWFLWLSYLKSALNPLIYYWRIKKFRDACMELLPKTFKFLPQLPGRTRRRVRPSAIYVCGEHRSVV